MEQLTANFVKEAQRIEEDALHSAKAQFAAASVWGNLHLWLGIPTAIAAAIAGVSALKNHPTLAGVLAILVAALSAIATFLNPSGRANANLNAGNQYLSLRNRARVFREVELLSGDSTTCKNTFQQLVSRRDELNTGSPQISRWAYQRGKKGIAEGESRYAADSGA